MSDPAAATRRARRARGPGRLSARDAAELPQRVLDAAEQVFIDAGYARSTMDVIARAAGVSRKTLYARYANKSDVLTAVVERLLDAALAAPAVPAAAAAAASADPRAVLLALGRELAQLSAMPRVAGLNRLIFAEAAQLPELAALFGRLYARAATRVRDCLQALQADARLAAGDDELAAVAFIEMVASMPRLRSLLGQPLSPAEIEAGVIHAVDLFLDGRAVPDRPGAPAGRTRARRAP